MDQLRPVPLHDINQARRAAVNKHAPNSIEDLPADSPLWLPILTAELGEIAAELRHQPPNPTALRDEITQVAAITHSWLAAIDQERLDWMAR